MPAVPAKSTLLGSSSPDGPAKTLTPGVAQEMARREAAEHIASSPDLQQNRVHGPMLRKQSTTSVKREEFDVLVTKYTCRDASALGSLGKHCKEISWTVQAGHDAASSLITVNVDKSIMLSPEVSIQCDGKTLFPHDSSRQKMKLLEDFSYQWPFRGSMREGVNQPNRFEVRPHHGREEWFPATITKQRDDGLFEALVKMPDNYSIAGIREVNYPALNKIDIRDVMTKEPLHVVEQVLVLQVPQQDPLRALLTINGQESALSFGRPTPKQGQDLKQISMILSDDCRHVKANVGHRVLSHFLSGDARRVVSAVQRHCHSWTVQLGPFAEHSIKVERQAWPSKQVTLTVDNETFVDGSVFDFCCENNQWEFKFRFSGEKAMHFDVFESNMDGVLLETRGQAITRKKCTYNCSVVLRDEFDFSKAELYIDDNEFHDLHLKATEYEEADLCMGLEALKSTYGLEVPGKINWSAPVGVVAGLRALAVEGGASDTTAGLAVVKAAAANAAYLGAASAISAAASGAAMVSDAAVEASPHVARAAGQAGTNLSAWCCCAKPDAAASKTEVDEIAIVR
jgi:hypothetical protein